jgi:hypothetical protein
MADILRMKSERVEITPLSPTRLTGMKEKDRHIGIHSILEANAILLSDGSDYCFIFSFDSLFVTKELKECISKKLEKSFGVVGEENLLILATHTHFAPSIEKDRIGLGAFDSIYFEFLTDRINVLIDKLIAKPEKAVFIKAAFGKTNQLTCNRRRRVRKLTDYFSPFISMEPNSKGFKDETFKILKLISIESNKLLSVIWSFPCHPTNYPDSRHVSAEFPGAIRKFIREKIKDDEIPVVYLPGFAGDVRAAPPSRSLFYRKFRDIFNLSYPVSYYRFANIDEYSQWVNAVSINFGEIWSADDEYVAKNNFKIKTCLNKMDLASIGIDANPIKDLYFRRIGISDEIAMYTISAEPVTEYSIRLNDEIPEKFSICSGYADEVFGYYPTQKQIDEGGYESIGFFINFRIKGAFKKNIEEQFLSGFRKIM